MCRLNWGATAICNDTLKSHKTVFIAWSSSKITIFDGVLLHCKKCNCIFSSLRNLLSLKYKHIYIFLKLHKNPCQTNKITQNIIPTSQTQLSEQRISYCWNVKALSVPSMHCSMNKLCSYYYRIIVLPFADLKRFCCFLSLLLAICCTVM